MKIAFIFILSIFISTEGRAQSDFVQSINGKFYIGKKEYRYFGANYWYGGLIAIDSQGKKRLTSELDFMKSNGVSNLRVMLSAEGDSTYPYRISPSLQPSPRVYNEELLKSFDYFLVEVAKRDMKVVFVLSNNWEWSGGLGQYLEWAKYPNPILPKTPNWDWDRYCDYISQFYSCDSCQSWYQSWISHVVTRQNTISKQYYNSDPAIMSWELANEPRPMRKSAIDNYINWVQNSSKFIKNLDKNHLVTVGVEGMIGTAMDSGIFKEIHVFPSIDYTTIHIWPKTWAWYNGSPSHAVSDTTLAKTEAYIHSHAIWSRAIHKPMVVEEFGLHRDQNDFLENSFTSKRLTYFNFIFDIGQKNGVAGYNFWGAMAGRDARIKGDYWQKGMPYTADPPQEEQGLYGVYPTDHDIWKSISMKNKILNKN